jgi:hypothetical protein
MINRTIAFVLGGLAAGALAGIAVGYWEARPWAAGRAPEASQASGAGATAQAAAGVPQAVVPDTTFRFGNMESGDTQRHVFPVRNAGTAPLTLSYVSHTCKCTEVRLDDKPVDPGATLVVPPQGEAQVMLQWAAKVPPGPFRHGASFTTTDPKLSRLEFTVEGEVVDSATLQPASLSFGTVTVGKPGTAELTVFSFIEPAVEIRSYEILDADLAKRIRIEFEPVPAADLVSNQAKAAVKVLATYEPGASVGPFNGSLRLETSLKDSAAGNGPRRLEVPISGTVKGDIWVFGLKGWSEAAGLLRMPPVKSAEGGKAQLFVNLRGDHADATDVRLASNGVSPPELKATLGKRQTVRPGLVRIPLTIEIPPGTRPMVRAGEELGGEGQIELETTHPITSKVRIRVFFTVEP